ncbi:hypothetical protein GCM10023205_45310 [Yinghuangia aomiensis]|uniref:Polyketide cyclase / dehydrase and lipid transport n=1 Tax=Yinghuangia aomiensis TaxID=676205 RepID=A0ABP9HLG8_9ACTN
MPAPPLYIETFIRATPDAVWDHTREPGVHRRWDLRFTAISELGPERGPGRCRHQSFRYATRVCPGMTIDGRGTTTGEHRRPDGTGASSLRFASAHRFSPIREGRGYWRYIPTADGVRFLTGYDYAPGFGGRALDRLVRPLMGWATAWSFDRLRLWLETGASPERLFGRAAAEAAARVSGVAAMAWLTGSAAITGLAAGTALLVPPLPGTPAARRCRRTPPDRRAATPPAALARLEAP